MTDTLSKAAVASSGSARSSPIEGQVRDLPGARPAPPFAGRIAFAHVRFGYAAGPTVS